MKLWDASTGQELRALHMHEGDVESLALSPDGTRLASGGSDLTVKVWDIASGQQVRTLKGLTGWVTSLIFSPDGRQLASGSSDGAVNIWDARPLTPEVHVEREAFGLVDFLFGKGLAKTQVLDTLRSNRTISEPVRQKAVAFAEAYHKDETHPQE